MTQPSKLLEAIATTLRVALTPPQPDIDTPLVTVRVVDETDEDVSEFIVAQAPSVLVSLVDMQSSELLDSGGPIMEATFIARCYARLPRGPNGAKDSRGDVAMDLAASVAALVEQSIWRDESGVALALRRAESVRVTSYVTRASLESGSALWIVRWRQLFEVTRQDITATLYAFRRMHVHYAMGDLDAPDAEQHIEIGG